MKENNNLTDNHFQLYVKIAKKINDKLQNGKVTVIRTDNMGRYCDTVSLEIDDDLFKMMHDKHDDEIRKVIFDSTFEINKRKYYIEPYNRYLLNIAF